MSEHQESTEARADGDDGEPDQQHGIHQAVSLPAPRRKKRVWPWVVIPLALALVVAGTMIPLPYFVDGPGLVEATQPLIEVSGHRSYTSNGEVMFTTVSERRATPFLMAQAWLDSSIDAVPEKVAVPSGDSIKERRVEQQMMDRSKLTALEVAFDVLKLPLTIKGSGAFINEVQASMPAAKVLHPGDVITAVDGSAVKVVTDLGPLLTPHAVGDHVTLSVRRQNQGKPVDVAVELGANADDASHGFLGVVVSTADEDVDTGFDVELDSGSVIGPSAGLAWTLGVIDRLSPGDLTHGKRVAVTGTISPDGSVGPIGGISQKVVGAKNAGATLFLYPASTEKKDVERMTSLADGDLQLKPVATVQDALEILDPKGLGAG